MAAPDGRYDSFDFPEPGRLSSLHRLAERTSIYFSAADAVLALSMSINLGAKCLGQDGPHDRFNTSKFPPVHYRTSTAAASRTTVSTSLARTSITVVRRASSPTSPRQWPGPRSANVPTEAPRPVGSYHPLKITKDASAPITVISRGRSRVAGPFPAGSSAGYPAPTNSTAAASTVMNPGKYDMGYEELSHSDRNADHWQEIAK